MSKFITKYKAYLLTGYAFLLLVHFILKDRFYLTGIIFYAFPLPIILLISTILLVVFFSDKKLKIILSLVLLCLTFLWFNNCYFLHNSDERNEEEKTLIFWNVNKQKDFNLKQLKEITENKSVETIFLVEAIHEKSDYKNKVEKELHDYKIEYLKGNMIVASKNKIETLNSIQINQDLNLNHIRVDNTTYILVDIYASPIHHKKDALYKVIEYANKNNIDVILGDFNTPFESIHFEKYKSNYTSLRAYQNGFSATWPFGIPLLELDQIWLKNEIIPLELEKLYCRHSDHAILIGKFKIE